MQTDADRDRDDERNAWNDALASGDPARIDRTADDVLDRVHRRLLDGDPNYAAAGWEASR